MNSSLSDRAIAFEGRTNRSRSSGRRPSAARGRSSRRGGRRRAGSARRSASATCRASPAGRPRRGRTRKGRASGGRDAVERRRGHRPTPARASGRSGRRAMRVGVVRSPAGIGRARDCGISRVITHAVDSAPEIGETIGLTDTAGAAGYAPAHHDPRDPRPPQALRRDHRAGRPRARGPRRHVFGFLGSNGAGQDHDDAHRPRRAAGRRRPITWRGADHRALPRQTWGYLPGGARPLPEDDGARAARLLRRPAGRARRRRDPRGAFVARPVPRPRLRGPQAPRSSRRATSRRSSSSPR